MAQARNKFTPHDFEVIVHADHAAAPGAHERRPRRLRTSAMLAVVRAARQRADVAARTLIAVGAYAAVVDSFLHEKELEDEPALERTVALLDNRSRNYGVPQEVAVFYAKGAANESQPPQEEKSILSWRASEGVRKRNFVRCRGGEAEMLANYELQGALGSGAFATVRRAVDRTTGFPRAIKMVRTGQYEGLEQELKREEGGAIYMISR